MLTHLVAVTGVLLFVMLLVCVVLGFVLWTRYRMRIEAAEEVQALIEANKATPRPGMATPDRRFRVASRRGPYAR
jgi:uncharacterized membrane protein YqiK